VVLAVSATACSGGTTIQPSPVEDPVIACPADLAVTAHNGQEPTVTFEKPVALKGQPPVTVTCTPESGSTFKNGVTTITCEASDARAHKASCTFSVSVTPIPLLVKTKFMAFGDSLTEGKNPRFLSPTIVQVPSGYTNLSGSYPEALNTKLTARYQDQTITMVAFGWGGEFAGDGKLRLRDHWGEFNPDAVMIMEGTNDITDVTTGTPAGMEAAMNSVIDALRTDVTFAKSRGAFVFLGTLVSLAPPVAPNSIAAIPTLNNRIKNLAVEQNVPLVDINAVVPSNMLGSDGIHPRSGSDAYSLMADEWMKAIEAKMEVPLPSAQ